jgi:hypothetical protein
MFYLFKLFIKLFGKDDVFQMKSIAIGELCVYMHDGMSMHSVSVYWGQDKVLYDATKFKQVELPFSVVSPTTSEIFFLKGEVVSGEHLERLRFLAGEERAIMDGERLPHHPSIIHDHMYKIAKLYGYN